MTAIPTSVLVVLATVVLATAGIARAQDGPPRRDDVQPELGGRVWATSGYSSRKIAAGSIARLSDLRFRGVDALVSEVSVDLVWKRLVGLASVGGGFVNDGVLIDEDFAANGERIGRTHYLRSDLRRDPSFRDEADGGIGWQADGALHYAITPHLSGETGFRYWKLDAAEGVDIAFTTVGAFRQRLTEATTERYGPFIGVRWRF